MYRVKGILHTSISGTFRIGFSNRQVEERAQAFDIDVDELVYYLRVLPATSFYVPMDMKMKYISVGRFTAEAMAGSITIFYELVDASRTELIWEFLRRGKNP